MGPAFLTTAPPFWSEGPPLVRTIGPRTSPQGPVRYYGWYSAKTRGQRAQRPASASAGAGIPARSPTAREARKGWAALIKQVYAADPICCPACGAEMKTITFIERHQTEAIEKILRHCGLWEEQPARAPPGEPVCVEG